MNFTMKGIPSQRTDNTGDKILLDREGQICNYGDILYDKYGYEYRFKGIRHMQPHGLFQWLLSVGKAGYKAVLTLIPNEKLNYYTDTIFVDLEDASKWYSHKRFGKGLKKLKESDGGCR